MKNKGIFAILTTVVFGAPIAANAAYPAYNTQNNSYQNYSGYAQQQPVYQQVQPVQQQNTSVNPTRVTGNIPRVGNTSSGTAGRQYYQPADYDRLADSGLYIGLSLGYSTGITGGMSADYKSEKNAYFVPGAFQTAAFKSDSVMPIQLSVGAAINNDVRVDFSYSRYRGIEYNNVVMSSDGAGGYVKTQATGGAVTANATMLNLYYNVDSYTGYFAGGALRPYIGGGVGLSLNTIADYVVYDGTFYSEADPASAGAGTLTGISDIYAYHNGGTSEQLAYMLEGGVSTELDGGIKLDFFVRYSALGQVTTSGSIVVSQTEWLADGADMGGGEHQAPYDSVFHYTNWYESGSIGTLDLGVRMRLQF